MFLYGLAGASDFQTGNLEIPRSLMIMLGVFLSVFVQMCEAVWGSWWFKPFNRVVIGWLSHMHAGVERFLFISLFKVHEEKDMHVPVHTQMKN